MSTPDIKQQYPLVFCIWEDITASDSTWKETDEAVIWMDNQVTLVHQSGFLFEKTEDHLIIVDSFLPNEGLIGLITKIPIGTIREYKVIQI